MVTLNLPTVGGLDVQIDWRNPGGAGSVRVAHIRGMKFVYGRHPGDGVGVQFNVIIQDDAMGTDEDLRRRAFALILPALRKFRHAAGQAPLSIAAEDVDPGGRRTTVRMVVSSEDGARFVVADTNLPVRPEETHEDRVYRLAPIAFRTADAIVRDLEAFVSPVVV